MEWMEVAKVAGGAVASGTASFFAAWGRFKQKLEEHEKQLIAHAADLAAFRVQYAQDKEHRRELEELRDRERASRPDPLEDIRNDIERLQADIEKLREKSTRYVRSDTFANFTKAQEDQWKDMMRMLGRLDGLFK